MRFTNLFTKTKKDAPKDELSRNAQLLIRAGFIHKEMAGVYSYLPLGLRVLNKINGIIREEMNAIGGQEILMSSLQSKELWEITDRWDDEKVDVWFKTRLKNDTDLGLGLTHEEPLTNIMKSHISSYKDLPKYVYQIQNKFRNEVRSKSGILRGREFYMKDLYSFNRDQEGLDKFYEDCKRAYMRIFERAGIGNYTFETFASGGIFAEHSHEFQAICAAGEDKIYVSKKKKLAVNEEVYNDEVLADLKLDKGELEEFTSIEVGNIFKLGTRFSKSLGLQFADESGELKDVIMGSNGIGCGRLMGTIVEILSDERGIVWPASVAPYEVHLIGLNLEDSEVAERADKAYSDLVQSGIEVLFDDRKDIPAGQKFADADLMGMPYRVVVSAKTGVQMEVKERTSDRVQLVNLEEAVTLFHRDKPCKGSSFMVDSMHV